MQNKLVSETLEFKYIKSKRFISTKISSVEQVKSNWIIHETVNNKKCIIPLNDAL